MWHEEFQFGGFFLKVKTTPTLLHKCEKVVAAMAQNHQQKLVLEIIIKARRDHLTFQ